MRGSDAVSGSLFSYVDLESRVRSDHPLRPIRRIVNEALLTLGADFEAIYAAGVGRPSIPPERLLRALLLQAFYGIRSERQIMERLDYDLLFRWFVGLGVDDAVWDQTSFGKNRDRLLAGDVAHKFLAAVLAHPKVTRLLSTEHFSVDGTMIEAWASMKSVRPKDGSGEPPAHGRNRESDFHGERRTNDTHQSTTDPDARLYRKGAGREAKLGFIGHALMENRNGLVVDACLTVADGHAERIAALHSNPAPIDRAASRWGPTRATTPRTSSLSFAPSTSPRTSRLRSRAPPLTDARPAMPDTRSARSSESASRRPSAGQRPPPGCARPGIAASIASAGSSPSRSPPTPNQTSQAAGRGRVMSPTSPCRQQPAHPTTPGPNSQGRITPRPAAPLTRFSSSCQVLSPKETVADIRHDSRLCFPDVPALK